MLISFLNYVDLQLIEEEKILGHAVDEKKGVLRNEFNIVQLPFHNFLNKACLKFEVLYCSLNHLYSGRYCEPLYKDR